MANADSVLGEALSPLCSLVEVEVIECAEHRRPRHGAVTGVVFLGAEGPGDRFDSFVGFSEVADIATLIAQTDFLSMRSSLLDTG